MYEPILDKIKTKEDVELMHWEIDQLLDGLYENKGFGFENILENRVRYWLAELLKQEFAKEGDKEKYLKGLKERLTKLREVGITLAYEPTQGSISRIVDFVKNNAGSDVVLNLNFDPNIIGGAQIVFGGNYRDFSFKKAFEKEFERSRGEILKTLRQKEETGTNSEQSSSQKVAGVQKGL